jgi:DHA1 family quinolone resistance protein-like MFS transporter
MAGAAIFSSFTYVPILLQGLGANNIQVTWIAGAYSAAVFISSYIFGRAGDIHGRRLILRAGLLASTLSVALLFLADSVEMLLVIRIVTGFCVGVYPGALAAYAHDSKMKMGRFASFGAVGWGVGTIIAGFAAGLDIHYAFLISSSFFMIAFLSALTLPPVSGVRVKVPLFPVETIKRNFPVYLGMLIRHSSAHAMWTLWPLFLLSLEGADLFMIGIIQATNALAQVVFMLWLTDRFDSRKLISIGLITSAMAFASFTLITNIFEVLPTQILLGLAWACLYVGALKHVTERNVEKSTASGLLQSVMSISGVIGPLIAFLLISIWPGYFAIMINAAMMSIVAFLMFVFSSKRAAAHESNAGERDLQAENELVEP